jgi:hypothetical protein
MERRVAGVPPVGEPLHHTEPEVRRRQFIGRPVPAGQAPPKCGRIERERPDEQQPQGRPRLSVHEM